jgi:metallo-beta-lactamase class B
MARERAQEKAQESSKVQLSSDVFVEKIDDGVWRHVSHINLPGTGPFPSNGLIVQLGAKVLMVDTACNNEQTKLILDWIEKELKTKPFTLVVTHYHSDRLGGIAEVHRRKIETVSSELTARLAKEQGSESPKVTFADSIDLSQSGREIWVRYPGPGHTTDNVVVWIPDRKILFGGCLIKSAQAKDLGNTKDADMEQWPRTVEKVYQEFGQARIVVPGHGDPTGIEAIRRTLELLQANR